jgi:hypothetical protein
MLNGIVAPDQEAEPCVSDWIFRSAWTSGIRPHRAGRENSHGLFTRRKFGSYRSNPPAKVPGAAMMVNRIKFGRRGLAGSELIGISGRRF